MAAWKFRLRAAARNLLLVSASLTLTLGMGELAARVLRRATPGGKEDRATPQYMMKDPVLGWRKKPSATAAYRRREYSVEVRTNALGMRDPERARTPPPGTLRLLALGDSFVEGYSVALESTLTQVLEGRLNLEAGCPVEVLNGGTAAWSTDQEYLYYREEAWALGANVVMLFLYYNDILANLQPDYWGQGKPVLEERDGRLEIAPRPTPKPGARAARDAREEAGEADAPVPRASGRSALLDFVRERLLRGQPRLYQSLARAGLWAPLAPEAPKTEMRIYEARLAPLLQVAWQRTLRIVEGLRDEAEARGARLVVIYVPAAFEVDERAWQLTELAYGMSEPAWRRSALAERLVNAGRRRGFAVLDLTAALREAEGGGATYFVLDHHWTPLGHQAAAGALAAYLREGGYVVCP
ncbi:MAG TPA: SGNH/GDSL hydrolase family protein [Vicinamibacteria bacterium]|nr:SGNH/GDSL hydrolase family protein [Vicinamibacteria bacterium]